MEPVRSALPTIARSSDDGVTAAALAVVRRALVEGIPVTREAFAAEAAFALDRTSEGAMREVDAAAQRLGISSLS